MKTVYHNQGEPGSILRSAEKAAKLLKENTVSRRIEDKPSLHRYSANIRQFKLNILVDIIAG